MSGKARAKTEEKRGLRRASKHADDERMAVAVLGKAIEIRDAALAEYNEVKASPEIYDDMDPGDAEVTLEGSGHNVCRVLRLLELLGVPGCEL